MITKHVSLTWNPVLMHDWLPAVLSVHPGLVVIPPAPPVMVPALPYMEMAPVPIFWPPGAAPFIGTHKLTSTVLHEGCRFALEDHDCGKLIPHLPTLPEFTLVWQHILKSSRKVRFSTSKVSANGAPVGCCAMWVGDSPPTPGTACGTPPTPVMGTGFALMNTLIVGMTYNDWFAGAAAMLVEHVLALVSLGSSFLGGGAKGVEEIVFRDEVNDEVSGQIQDTGGDLSDPAALAEALVRVYGQETGDYDGDVVFTGPEWIPTWGGGLPGTTSPTWTRHADGSLDYSTNAQFNPSLPEL